MYPLIVAHILFWVLLLIGASDMGRRACAIYIGLWLGGLVMFNTLRGGGLFFVSYVAVLDIVLVLHVFGGDVQL